MNATPAQKTRICNICGGMLSIFDVDQYALFVVWIVDVWPIISLVSRILRIWPFEERLSSWRPWTCLIRTLRFGWWWLEERLRLPSTAVARDPVVIQAVVPDREVIVETVIVLVRAIVTDVGMTDDRVDTVVVALEATIAPIALTVIHLFVRRKIVK